MKFTPAFLDDLKDRASIVEVVGRKVSWNLKKSTPGKGDYWACCPFHGEKTPSFHVREREGRYKCFGCHESGNAIDFIMQTENVSFPEAVRILAEIAGVPLPEQNPRAEAEAQRRKSLSDAMEAALKYFTMQLSGARAQAARKYLSEKRKLSAEAVKRFEIGYAPESWEGLTTHLREQGFTVEQIVGAGLGREGSRPGAPYDAFRDRIMFPIRDARERCIAFGGRAMAADAQAKYINSPETALFQKGQTLYNIAPARRAAGKGTPIIAVEGYMDVIALGEAGFEGAVAPLGTAMTEQQLALLWRMNDEPIIALDGDAAGRRAADKVLDLALPKLSPGKSLRFIFMPEGQDPDDFLQAKGPQAMQELIDGAQSFLDTLWAREAADAAVVATPERRAAFEERLKTLLRSIEHKGVAKHYWEALKQRKDALMGGRAQGRAQSFPRNGKFSPKRGGAAFNVALGPNEATLRSEMATSNTTQRPPKRELALLAVLLNHPDLIDLHQEKIENLQLSSPELDTIRIDLLSAHADIAQKSEDIQMLRDHIDSALGGHAAVETLRKTAATGLPSAAKAAAPIGQAETFFLEVLNHHAAHLGCLQEKRIYYSELDDEQLANPQLEEIAALRLRAAQNETVLSVTDGGPIGDDEVAISERFKSLVDEKPWIKRDKRG